MVLSFQFFKVQDSHQDRARRSLRLLARVLFSGQEFTNTPTARLLSVRHTQSITSNTDLMGNLERWQSMACLKSLRMSCQKKTSRFGSAGTDKVIVPCYLQYLLIRINSADLLNNVLSHDPMHFREFIMSQKPFYPLLVKLIDRVLAETDVGLLSQFVEVMRILVDIETMEDVCTSPQSLKEMV